MEHRILTEEEWNKFPPRRIHSVGHLQTRPILWNHIVDVVSDTGNRHCYITDKHMSGRELHDLSTRFSGDWWGKKGHFIHTSGNHSEVYVHKDKWSEYLLVRKATQEMVQKEDVGWHPAQCGRTICNWLAFRERHPSDDLVRVLLPHYSMHACLPCHLPYAYEHDMSGAYWQIVRATPTPRLHIHSYNPQVISYSYMDKETKAKWQKMIDFIGTNNNLKPVRLAIVGNWVARYSQRKWRYSADWHFRNGEIVKTTNFRPSGLSTFGLLIVRMVYELCQEEFIQDQGVYAWVDCVITQKDTPSYWNQLQIPSTTKHEGELYLYSANAFTLGGTKVGGAAILKKPAAQLLQPKLLDRSFYYHRKLLPRWGVIPPQKEELPPPTSPIKLDPQNLLIPRNMTPRVQQPPIQPQIGEQP